MQPPNRWPRRALACLLLISVAAGCSLRRMAVDTMAEALSSQSGVFASDDDPELVRAAVPFGLKTLEALIAASPRHRTLLLAACRGFTQYSHAFVQNDADLIAQDDYQEASRLRERALHLYLRARDYGLRGLEIDRPEITQALQLRPKEAAAGFGADDIELLYWTAAAWGSAISLGLDRPDLLADVGAVRAMLDRVLELDEAFGGGAIHTTMITFECLPAMGGGSENRAKGHFARAIELTDGESAVPYVVMAESVCVGLGDPAGFRRLLTQALSIDAASRRDYRLSNVLAKRRASHLLETFDELFPEPLDQQ